MVNSRTRKKFLPLVSVLFPPEEQDNVRDRLLAESPSRHARHATDSYKKYQREYYQRKKLLKQTGK